ncbi:hypothetical protein IKP85_00960 [bacterium]|nr:hypothetical protein [bacterium]
MVDTKEARIVVSELIRKVLVGELTVQKALPLFPSNTGDKSIDAAFHALVHYEADEDFRNHDIMYKEEQDDYLTLIFQTLETGEPLPDNIIRNYEKYYKKADIPMPNDFKSNLIRFWRFLTFRE